MMRLQTMDALVRTLDADGHSAVADAVVAPWDHDTRPAFWRASANFQFVVEVGGRRCFLRFIGTDERNRTAIEQECAFVRWLHAEGVAVALPIAARDGTDVVTVDTQIGPVFAVLWEGARGEHPEIDTLHTSDFRRWGAALGAVHAASARYDGPTSTRLTWRDHIDLVFPFTDASQTTLMREWTAVRDQLAALPVDAANYGLIHFDFELDNLVWRDGTITAIDWDDCATMWFAADIAYALRDLALPTIDRYHPSEAAFLQGYRSRFALDPALLDRLSLFMRLHALILYGRLEWACDLDPDAEYPDWLRDLDARLRARNSRYLASLEAQAFID